MKVSIVNKLNNSTIDNQNNNKSNESANFKGGDAFLRYLATNQAVGANGVDLTSMVAPRTASDMIRRGPLAGLETLRREIMGTVNDSLIGVYGIVAGSVIAATMGISNKYGVNANTIMAAPETVKILSNYKSKQINEKSTQIDYFKDVFSNFKAFNPNHEGASADGFVKLNEKQIEEVSRLMDSILKDESMDFKKWSKNKTPNSLDSLVNKITEYTGAQSKYLLEYGEAPKGSAGTKEALKASEYISSDTNLKTFLEDVYKVSDAFNKPEVKKAFEEQVQNGKSALENKFVNTLLKFKKSKAAAGFAAAAMVGLSVQPINMYLTKKKTGTDGFVGVEGRTKDDSTGFKVLKGVTAAGFGAMVLATLKTGLKGFMGKMAFKGFWPTIAQLKGVYGITIISRLLSARDKDELRESLTKDTLGFLSWLILGDIINKMTAEGLDKSVLNRTKETDGKGFFKRVFNSTLKNRDEVLIDALASNGLATVKEVDGKHVSMSFKEMVAELDKLPEAVRKATKKRLSVLNKAQLAGYLFSGLVLGLGIPNLNIYITNKLDKKRKAALAEETV